MARHKLSSGHIPCGAEAPWLGSSLVLRPHRPPWQTLPEPALGSSGLLLGGRGLPGAAGQAPLGMDPGQCQLPTHGHYLLKT